MALILLAISNAAPAFNGPLRWTPDGFYYQAKVVQLRTGESAGDALAAVLAGTDAQGYISWAQRAKVHVGIVNPKEAEYSLPFFQRRWFLPALAALLTPIYGNRALLATSLAGYIVLAPFLFLLLRQRASVSASLVITAATLSIPRLVEVAGFPLTDSWGLALEAAALGFGMRYLTSRRSVPWLPLWCADLLVLSVTRELNLVFALATVIAALFWRSRSTAVLAGTAIATAVPAMFLGGAGIQARLAFAIDDYHVPSDDSLPYIFTHLTGAVWRTFTADVLTPVSHGNLTVLFTFASLLTGAVLALIVLTRRKDPALSLLAGFAFASLAYLAANPAPTGLRLALVVLPISALGFAVAVDSVARRLVAASGSLRRSGAAAASVHLRHANETGYDDPR